jgi:hypothetical protein
MAAGLHSFMRLVNNKLSDSGNGKLLAKQQEKGRSK